MRELRRCRRPLEACMTPSIRRGATEGVGSETLRHLDEKTCYRIPMDVRQAMAMAKRLCALGACLILIDSSQRPRATRAYRWLRYMVVLAAAHLGTPAQSIAETSTPNRTILGDSFAATIWFVQESGWPARLGPVCEKFGVAQLTPDCVFKQISVEELSGVRAQHGFNVPAAATREIPYALLFHLRPLVGEFFVVTPEAQLVSVYVRSKGTDYDRIPNDIAQQAFKSELSYWAANLGKIRTLRRLDPQSPDQRARFD